MGTDDLPLGVQVSCQHRTWLHMAVVTVLLLSDHLSREGLFWVCATASGRATNWPVGKTACKTAEQ